MSGPDRAEPQGPDFTPTHTWRSKDYDYPVELTGIEQEWSDGRTYAQVRYRDGDEVKENYVPRDELRANEAASADGSGAPLSDKPKPKPQRQAKPAKQPKRKAKAAAVNKGNGTAFGDAKFRSLFDLLVAIDDDGEFETALRKRASAIQGHIGAIREARKKRLQDAKIINMVAVRAAIDRLRALPSHEWAMAVEEEASRLANVSSSKLREWVKDARKADAAREREKRARERELGIGDPPPEGVFTLGEALAFFNDKYFVSHEGGRVFICEPRYDPVLHRRYIAHIRDDDSSCSTPTGASSSAPTITASPSQKTPCPGG
jgi:hypothetical protein